MKRILTFSLLLIALSGSYYLFVTLPDARKKQYELQKQELQLKQNEQTLAKEQMDSDNRMKQEQLALKESNLKQCLANAHDDFTANWKSACSVHKQNTKRMYNDCIFRGASENDCKTVWAYTEDLNGMCTMPKVTGNAISDEYIRQKDECNQRQGDYAGYKDYQQYRDAQIGRTRHGQQKEEETVARKKEIEHFEKLQQQRRLEDIEIERQKREEQRQDEAPQAPQSSPYDRKGYQAPQAPQVPPIP